MNYKIINLEVRGDERGSLVAIEKGSNCPFEIKRAFYIFGTKGETRRGCHANRKSQFLMVSLSGSCRVEISDGRSSETVVLDSPTKALWLDKMIWKEMFNFSENAVLLVLSDEKYDASEYIRDYESLTKESKSSAS